ncbi:single-stranded DNA-binding protein [Ignavigranum ruoffiae]|uniref:single-stranded DNA-binding protein n=1 Tax=Ignavigranum ruoffiae TaxID=89093 RepID=UPI0024ACFCE8|nr:single-stranded DNA-binding protein [Ignavigranum ruoffiae]
MNQVVFVGRLVRQPELKELAENLCVVNNCIAVHRPLRNQHGEEVTDFIPFVVWNRLAEILVKYCDKGDQIALSGRMQSRKYENKEKQTVYVVECLVTGLTLIAGPVNKAKNMTTDLCEEETFTSEEAEEFQKVISALKNKAEEVKI